MTTTGRALQIDAIENSAGVIVPRLPLQFCAGFFFAFRICITFLGFQSNPPAGAAFSLLLSGCLFVVAILYTLGDKAFSVARLLQSRTLRWLAAYLAVSGASLLWTGAESRMIATAYWSGMAMEVGTVLLLAKGQRIPQQVDAILRGFVVGTASVALIAWLSPTLPDLRIGHDEFLVPNLIGVYCALAFFLAQHLAFKNRVWGWFCAGLAITLLRTISKTSIIAFLIAESFYLLREKQISKSMKLKMVVAALVVTAAFSGVLSTYLSAYEASPGDPAATLTGRTLIWANSFSMSLEQPWIGHGIYSFRALIPAIGTFQPWHAHNELLQEFFEYGLLGVAVTIGLYLSLMIGGRRSPDRSFGRLAEVIVVFSLIHGLADTANFGLSLPLCLFAALAVPLMQPDALEAARP